MQFKKRDESLPQIIIIPMIDIMFFLLIFFMFSTMHMSNVSSIPVKLATMKDASVKDKMSGLVVTIDDKNEIYLGDERLDKAHADKQISAVVAGNPGMLVILRVDKDSDFGITSEVLNLLKQAGITKVAMAAEKRE